MNLKPFTGLNYSKILLRSIFKAKVITNFLIGNIDWVLVYGPPRTGTSLLARLLSYQSKFLFVDVGLHFARKYPESANWDERLSLTYYEKIYFNLLVNAHEGAWFHYKSFSRPIDLVIKQAALRPADYHLLCHAFGLPSRKIFCIREPSSYYQSHKKKFNQPDNIVDDYLFSLKTYEEIGGEIIEYSSRLDLPTYENILFSKKVNIPSSLNFNNHIKVETELESQYNEFKRKNIAAFATT
jgi:hypothetical protein